MEEELNYKSFDDGPQRIRFSVRYRRRKTFAIKISVAEGVSLSVPIGTSRATILNIIQKKSNWIVQKLNELKERADRFKKHNFDEGETFTYLGKNFRFRSKLIKNLKSPKVKLYQGKFLVETGTREKSVLRSAMISWYKTKALEKCRERIAFYQNHFQIQPGSIKLIDRRGRWGSCSSKGDIRFNWRCIMLPVRLLDYIVVHEMCHLVFMNHSKHFWEEIKKILPDYRERRKVLKTLIIEDDF